MTPSPVSLAFSETGDGAPLLILHGLFGSKRNWGGIAKALAAGRRVICLDLRNHGESPWDATMTYPALAADVAHFIQTHDLGPVDMIGHSMGGKAAMTLALAHPELLKTLTVVDIAPAPSPGTFIHYVEALKAMDLAQVTSRKDADALLAPTEGNPGIRAFLLQNLESTSDGYAWRVNLEALSAAMADLLNFDTPPQGQSYDGPALFLAGGASDYIQPQHHAEIQRLFPAARIENLPGIGHWAHAEAPELFLQHVTGFLGT
ncbi:MAG: alpha/beta fold hydrolase [Rhodospirillales bacterium]